MSNKLEREDYEDPACPFCVDKYQKEPPAKPIPVGRVIERLNEYFARGDASAAERHLLYWLEEAKRGGTVTGFSRFKTSSRAFTASAGTAKRR